MANNNLTVIDGETLADMRLPPAQYCVKSLLHQGVTILGGAPKIGKSWLVLDLCVRVTKGESVDGDTIDRLKMVNDQICAELGLPVFEPPRERKEKPMSSREYRVAEKSLSWKFAMMATIDLCMAYAGSKDELTTSAVSHTSQGRTSAGLRNTSA